MKIAFDIDGVFTDYEWFLNTYGERYLKKHREDYLLQNPEKYTFRERFGCSEKTELRFFSWYLFWYAKKMPIRENTMLPFRFSAVYLAQVTGCPIVPIVIRKKKDKFMVHVDKPIYISKRDDLNVKNSNINENMCQIYKGLVTIQPCYS